MKSTLRPSSLRSYHGRVFVGRRSALLASHRVPRVRFSTERLRPYRGRRVPRRTLLKANALRQGTGTTNQIATSPMTDLEAGQVYFYVAKNGIPVVLQMIETKETCRLTAAFEAKDTLDINSARLCWELFRKDKVERFGPDGKKLRDGVDVISAMTLTETAGIYRCNVDIPKAMLPVHFGCHVEINSTLISCSSESTVDSTDGEMELRPENERMRIPLGMSRGSPSPKGVHLSSQKDSKGSIVNFAVVSRNASSMVLCLVDKSGSLTELELLPEYHKTGDIWHVGLGLSTNLGSLAYGWRADGPHGWEGGSCFHPETILTDPYSKWTKLVKSKEASPSGEAVFLGSLSHLTSREFDWQETERPRRAFEQLIVTELDLTSLTPDTALKNASNVIAQMSEAGVNAVVLRGALMSIEDANGEPSPLCFFSPNSGIFTCPDDLRMLIQECHKHSMEVLLEMHFGFTGEDVSRMSLKGLDVRLYFRGKGILNCGHPVVQELILEALQYWTMEYRVDGFVFRHAETMTQDRDGTIQDAPALPEAIAADPVLRKCKLVAVSGDDQLLPRGGERGFPHWGCWTEYNSRFQFDFWDFMVNVTPAKLSNIATRITGSADLFAGCWDGGFPGSLAASRRPAFGFNSPVPFLKSLAPLIEANLPKQSDQTGTLTRALLMAVIISQGVPVIPIDCWSDPHVPLFLKKILDFRTRYLDLIQPDAFDAIRGIEWHSPIMGEQPEWDGGPKSHFIGYSIRDPTGRGFYVGFNGYRMYIDIQLPDTTPGGKWKCVAYSIQPETEEEILMPPHSMFQMSPQSAVIFELVPDSSAGFMPEI